MTATDLRAEALARIAEQRAHVAALSNVLIVRADLYQICNGYGPLLDLAEAVLLRHAPDPEPLELMLHMDEECPTGECENGDGHLSIVCRGCYPVWEEMPAHNVWPCPDAAAALRSLGLGEPTTSTGGASDAAERKAP